MVIALIAANPLPPSQHPSLASLSAIGQVQQIARNNLNAASLAADNAVNAVQPALILSNIATNAFRTANPYHPSYAALESALFARVRAFLTAKREAYVAQNAAQNALQNTVPAVKVKATVIFTSVSLIGQWEDEMKLHAPSLKVLR